MAGLGWLYPAGAADDPYAPYNVVLCSICGDEFHPPEMDEHMQDEHGISYDPDDFDLGKDDQDYGDYYYD